VHIILVLSVGTASEERERELDVLGWKNLRGGVVKK